MAATTGSPSPLRATRSRPPFSAGASQRSCAARATSPSETSSGSGRSRSRASVSSSVSSSARRTGLPLGRHQVALDLAGRWPSATADSSRSRRPVSGVRSWWDALATNSRCARSARASRAVMSLKAEATSCCSDEPSTRARASRSPPATRRAVAGEPPQRARQRSGQQPGEPEPQQQHDRGHADQGDHVAADLVLDRVDALGDPHRTFGAGRALTTGTAVNSRSSPSVSLWRSPWRESLAAQRGGDLGARRVGVDSSPSRRVGEQPAARADDDHAAAELVAESVDQPLERLALVEPARRRTRPAAAPGPAPRCGSRRRRAATG